MDTRVEPAYDSQNLSRRPYFVSENSVGVFPVTCRNACENAGTLA
jgi:hypothetical protein